MPINAIGLGSTGQGELKGRVPCGVIFPSCHLAGPPDRVIPWSLRQGYKRDERPLRISEKSGKCNSSIQMSDMLTFRNMKSTWSVDGFIQEMYTATFMHLFTTTCG